MYLPSTHLLFGLHIMRQSEIVSLSNILYLLETNTLNIIFNISLPDNFDDDEGTPKLFNEILILLKNATLQYCQYLNPQKSSELRFNVFSMLIKISKQSFFILITLVSNHTRNIAAKRLICCQQLVRRDLSSTSKSDFLCNTAYKWNTIAMKIPDAISSIVSCIQDWELRVNTTILELMECFCESWYVYYIV